ncbi:hypothetical protein B0H13DRAFT_1913271 [Mycena leptocephala]|nr:hypothetical protein B0H13DRAFT_1913271 [Mycena leptocephala]
MFSSTIVLLSTTLLGLTAATPLSARVKTCSPPAASKVSFTTPNLTNQGGSLPAGSISVGPMQMEMLALTGPFLLAMWVPQDPSQIGTQWNLIKSGSDFLIENTEVSGKFLTSVQGAGDVELKDGPLYLQKWSITCTTCPADGFATDCTFENFPFPNSPVLNQVCITNQTIPELGNETIIGDCGGPCPKKFTGVVWQKKKLTSCGRAFGAVYQFGKLQAKNVTLRKRLYAWVPSRLRAPRSTLRTGQVVPGSILHLTESLLDSGAMTPCSGVNQ